MSRLQELIDRLCPNGVEYYLLGDIASFSQGLQVPINQQHLIKEDGDIRFLRIIDYTNSDEPPRYIKKPNDKYIKKNNELIMIRYGTPGKVCLDYEGAIANNMFKIDFKSKNINIKFMYYYLSQAKIYNFLLNSIKSTMPSINFGIVSKISVPVPPLEVQREIVHILDDFTLLSAELSAELKARQNQLEFYRNSLLKIYNEVKNCSLKDISEYSKLRISSDKLNENNYVGVDNLLQNKRGKKKSEYVPNVGNSTQYNNGDILIGNIRPYLKKIWLADCLGGTNGDVLVIHITDKNVYPRYLYYILSSNNFFDYDNSNSKGAKMPRGNKNSIMNYKLYLPEFQEQIRISNMLEKFEKLSNSISDGIPAEIELRQKQYEYYRDKLLTFKELK